MKKLIVLMAAFGLMASFAMAKEKHAAKPEGHKKAKHAAKAGEAAAPAADAAHEGHAEAEAAHK